MKNSFKRLPSHLEPVDVILSSLRPAELSTERATLNEVEIWHVSLLNIDHEDVCTAMIGIKACWLRRIYHVL